MVDTPRPVATLLASLFQDGQPAGSISPQDMRDLIVSFAGRSVVDVKQYGALGDGSTDDATAISAAITAVAARGGTVFFPSGTYIIGSTITVPSNIRLVGEDKNATILKKVVNLSGGMLSFSGSSTSIRCQRGGISDMQLNGNTSTTGPLLLMNFADHHNIERVFFYFNGVSAVQASELWDTYFLDCEFEWCGTSVAKTGAVIWLAGTATDSTNQIYFDQCRWESFPGHALYLDSNGTANPPTGIFLSHCKMETSFCNGLSLVSSTNDVSYVHIRDSFLAANAVTTTAAPALIDFTGADNWILDGLQLFMSSAAALAGIFFFAGGQDYCNNINNISQAGSAFTNGVINFAGGNPRMHISGIRGVGAAYSGAKPTNIILNDVAARGVNAQSASYTVAMGDAGQTVEISNGSANTLTIPPNSSVAFPIGTTILGRQTGAGVTTITAGAGVTINTGSSLALSQWKTSTIVKRATDTWVAS